MRIKKLLILSMCLILFFCMTQDMLVYAEVFNETFERFDGIKDIEGEVPSGKNNTGWKVSGSSDWITTAFGITGTRLEKAPDETALRIVTPEDNGILFSNTPGSAANGWITANHPCVDYKKTLWLSSGVQDVWFSADIKLEDYNADRVVWVYSNNTASALQELFRISAGSGSIYVPGSSGAAVIALKPQIDKWHTFAVRMSRGATAYTLYIDGKQVGTYGTDLAALNYGGFRIGEYLTKENDGAYAGTFKSAAMQLDNIRMCNLASDDDTEALGFTRSYGLDIASFAPNAEGDTITIKFMQFNSNESEIPYLILMTVYGEDGVYKGFSHLSGTIAKFSEQTGGLPEITLDAAWSNGDKARAHILDGWVTRNIFSNEVYQYTDIRNP